MYAIRRRSGGVARLLLVAAAFVALEPGAAAAPLAELVSARTSDDVLLHGLLYSPPTRSSRVVIHIPGGPGSFYSVQDMAPMAEALNHAGWHFLSMNCRTAGSGFEALAHARFEDYREDVAAAVELARRHGLTNVVLLGHSLGTARVAYYVAGRADAAPSGVRLLGVVLGGSILSPYLEAQLRWSPDERAQYDAFLARQRERVAAGQGRELDAYPWAPGRRIELSAASWISVFGSPSESNASTIKFAAAFDVPVLLVHGTADHTALPDNARQLYAALSQSPSRELVWIDGGDHLFRGHEADFARIVVEWLRRVATSATGKPAATL